MVVEAYRCFNRPPLPLWKLQSSQTAAQPPLRLNTRLSSWVSEAVESARCVVGVARAFIERLAALFLALSLSGLRCWRRSVRYFPARPPQSTRVVWMPSSNRAFSLGVFVHHDDLKCRVVIARCSRYCVAVRFGSCVCVCVREWLLTGRLDST